MLRGTLLMPMFCAKELNTEQLSADLLVDLTGSPVLISILFIIVSWNLR